MKNIRNMKRPQLATIMAGLALFIVLGGSAAAAGGLINGKKIKKGTVTAKQLKNKTITKGKIAPSTLAGLAGSQGPRGADGAKGAQGPKGDQGIQGIQGPKGDPSAFELTTYSASGNSPINIPANTEKDVINMNNLAAGRYVINANVQAFTAGAGTVNCALSTNGNGGGTGATWTALANGRNVLAMTHSTDTAGVTHLDVSCESSGANSSYKVDVTAVKTTP